MSSLDRDVGEEHGLSLDVGLLLDVLEDLLLHVLRPSRSMMSPALVSVRSSVTIARTTASWAIVPSPSGGLAASWPPAGTVETWSGAAPSATVTLAKRPLVEVDQDSLPTT